MNEMKANRKQNCRNRAKIGCAYDLEPSRCLSRPAKPKQLKAMAPKRNGDGEEAARMDQNLDEMIIKYTCKKMKRGKNILRGRMVLERERQGAVVFVPAQGV